MPSININNYINDKRYDAMKECLTWKELNSFFYTSRSSVRRDINQSIISSDHNLRDNSKTKHLTFV